MGAVRGGGLTAKQQHFCRCVASGMSQAEAYREAYSVAPGKRATHIESASRLMARPEIRARVNVLIQQRERALLASAVSDRQKVLEKLRRWTDGSEEATPVQVRAAELLGKTQGMFRDVHEDGSRASSEALAGELESLLAELSGASGPGAEPGNDRDPDDPDMADPDMADPEVSGTRH